MNHLFDAAKMGVMPLKQCAPGTLIMMPTHTNSAQGPFWGLMYSGVDEDGDTLNVLWLNGMPWNGSDPSFYGMAVNQHPVGDWLALNCGAAKIHVDLMSGVGRTRDEIRYDQAQGFVAPNARGTFLMGERGGQPKHFGRNYLAINIDSWTDERGALEDRPIDWFSSWQIVVGAGDDAMTLALDARARIVAQVA